MIHCSCPLRDWGGEEGSSSRDRLNKDWRWRGMNDRCSMNDRVVNNGMVHYRLGMDYRVMMYKWRSSLNNGSGLNYLGWTGRRGMDNDWRRRCMNNMCRRCMYDMSRW